MNKIIGIDIGGTKCAVTLGHYFPTGEILIIDKISFPTEVPRGFPYTIDMILKTVAELLVKSGMALGDIQGIGISCGGPLDCKRGIIMSPPNLIGWDSVPIVELLEKRLDIKCRLQNDANACALAEWKFGAAKGYRNIIFLTFGTGLGAGLILDGRLYNGTNDMAGEVGHIRLAEIGPVGYGKAGSFEGFCSGGGITQLARIKVLEKLQMGKKATFCESMKELDSLSAKKVGEAAENGDELAKEIFQITGNYLGKGLSILIDILNPEIIVIGSIFARCESLLRDSAFAVIKKESLSSSQNACKIVPAGLGENLGDYAAIAVALYE